MDCVIKAVIPHRLSELDRLPLRFLSPGNRSRWRSTNFKPHQACLLASCGQPVALLCYLIGWALRQHRHMQGCTEMQLCHDSPSWQVCLVEKHGPFFDA